MNGMADTAEDRVVDVSDLEPGGMQVVEAAGLKILICNVEGRYFAVEDLCTHAAIPLSEGRLEGCVVECSVHGARFDVSDGSVVRRPALRPLWTFPVSDEPGSDESNSEGSKVRIRIHLGVPV